MIVVYLSCVFLKIEYYIEYFCYYEGFLNGFDVLYSIFYLWLFDFIF